MFSENKYRNETDMKYPSLEPMDLENADPNATLPTTRPSSKRSLNEEGWYQKSSNNSLPNHIPSRVHCAFLTAPNINL